MVQTADGAGGGGGAQTCYNRGRVSPIPPGGDTKTFYPDVWAGFRER